MQNKKDWVPRQPTVKIFLKHQILFQRWLDGILYIAYSIFWTHTTSVTAFCLPAGVFTVYCLISIELPTVCSSRDDGCSILSRESIGKSCPWGQDWSMLLCWQGCTLNPSLIISEEMFTNWGYIVTFSGESYYFWGQIYHFYGSIIT